jgi:hypothetical protein
MPTLRSSTVRRINRRTAAILAGFALGALLLALLGVIPSRAIPGQPVAADVTVTISSRTQVHPTGSGGCYVRVPQTYRLTVLGPDGRRDATLGGGRIQSDGSCGFSAVLPASPDASAVVVNGGLHEVTGAVGTLTLSSDDGRWVPMSAGAL